MAEGVLLAFGAVLLAFGDLELPAKPEVKPKVERSAPSN